jgi:hypothetical protein
MGSVLKLCPTRTDPSALAARAALSGSLPNVPSAWIPPSRVHRNASQGLSPGLISDAPPTTTEPSALTPAAPLWNRPPGRSPTPRMLGASAAARDAVAARNATKHVTQGPVIRAEPVRFRHMDSPFRT